MNGSDPYYKKEADNLGGVLSKYKYSLLYGGGDLGLMGIAAKSAYRNNVKITSIFPEYLDDPKIIFSDTKNLIKTKKIFDRKEKMIQLSDIFICLPGGIGTLDEITEVLSSAALGEHKKPIFLINTNKFWDPLINLLKHMEENKFIRRGKLNESPLYKKDEEPKKKTKLLSFDQFKNFMKLKSS